MRGGPSSSVVEPPVLLGSLGPKALQRGVRTSRRGPPTASDFFILGAKLAPSSQFFAICLHFFRTMLRSCVFSRFPMVFEWILEGLGKGSGGVLEVVFHTIFKKLDFLKNKVFPRENL